MRLRLSASILLLIFLAACGVKGSLRPIGTSEPVAPAWLELKQQGDAVLLRWERPQRNQDGSPLTDLTGFRVGRYNYEPEQFCAECLDQETVTTIDLDAPGTAITSGDDISLRLPHAGPGSGNRYRIYPLTGDGGVGPYAEASLVMKTAPPQPLEIRGTPLDRGARLSWQPANLDMGNTEVIGVNIYRGTSDGPLAIEPLNDTPVSDSNFDNFGLENGVTYRFGLRSVIRIDGVGVESILSEIVTVTPQAGL